MIACPNCGANLKFHIETQDMFCDSCDSHFDPYHFDKKSDAEENTYYDATILTCPQCGGELVSTENEATTFCPFCGASTILTSRLTKELRPNYMVPFQVSKEGCKEAYARYIKKAIFAPKELRDPAFLERFRGIYMPYWTYRIFQKGRVTVKGTQDVRKGDYVYHHHYDLTGDLDAYYLGYSFDASSSFYDDISSALAPFDAKQLKEFTPGFLSGFYADVADIPKTTYKADACDLANKATFDYIKGTKDYLKYSIKETENNQNQSGMFFTKVSDMDATMFPVWFLTYRNKDRLAYITVNGQTGKVVCDTPIDTKKYVIFSALLAIPIYFFLNIGLTITPTRLLWAVLALLVVAMILFNKVLTQIKQQDENIGDKGIEYHEKDLERREEAGEFGENTGKNKRKVNKARLQVELSGREKKLFIAMCIMAGITAICAVCAPHWDIFCYSLISLDGIAILLAQIGMIANFNKLATRKLPQYEQRGGQEHAEETI